MAFPFQSGLDPVIAACKDSEYMIYCNTVVPASQRLRFWYQYANLSLVVVALSFPFLLMLLGFIRRWWKDWRHQWNLVPAGHRYSKTRPFSVTSSLRRKTSNLNLEDSQDLVTALASLPEEIKAVQSASASITTMKAYPSVSVTSTARNSVFGWRQSRISGIFQLSRSNNDLPSQPSSIFREDFRKSVRSFTIVPEDNSSVFGLDPAQNYDLGIIPLFSGSTDYSSYTVPSSRCPSPGPSSFGRGTPSPATGRASIQSTLVAGKHTLGLVDIQDFGVSCLLERGVTEAVRKMDILRVEQGCKGLAVRISDDASTELVVELLQTLFDWAVEVIVMCNSDAKIWSLVDFDQIAGIIIENGCILANGHRRDFFRATRVRHLMGKCAEKRVDRPSFFAGFYDLWHSRPSASVVRRSFKLAEFYGAAFEHVPLADAYWENNQRRKLPLSLGAFDYLKRLDTVEVCKNMRKQRLHEVNFHHSQDRYR